MYSKRCHQKPQDVAHHFIAEANDREGFDLLKINDIIDMLVIYSQFSWCTIYMQECVYNNCAVKLHISHINFEHPIIHLSLTMPILAFVYFIDTIYFIIQYTIYYIGYYEIEYYYSDF